MANETIEERVAALEDWQAQIINGEHQLSYSAAQIDAFFALLESRVFAAGSKSFEITYETRFVDIELTASELGVTNITNDIMVLFTVHALDYRYGDNYHYAFATSVISTTDNRLRLRFSEQMIVPEVANYIPKISPGHYRVNWLRIG